MTGLTPEQVRELLKLATGLEVRDPELAEATLRVNLLIEGLSKFDTPEIYAVPPTPPLPHEER